MPQGQFGSERRSAAQWSGSDAFSAKHFVLPVCDRSSTAAMLGFPEHGVPSLTASHSDEPFLTPRRTEARVLASEYPSERTDCVAIPHPGHGRALQGATYVLTTEVAGILTVAAGVSRE
jgi:hypothetical protein